MVVLTKFNIGDFVYLKTDPEQNRYIITGITVREHGFHSYNISFTTEDSWHYELELSSEITIF